MEAGIRIHTPPTRWAIMRNPIFACPSGKLWQIHNSAFANRTSRRQGINGPSMQMKTAGTILESDHSGEPERDTRIFSVPEESVSEYTSRKSSIGQFTASGIKLLFDPRFVRAENRLERLFLVILRICWTNEGCKTAPAVHHVWLRWIWSAKH